MHDFIFFLQKELSNESLIIKFKIKDIGLLCSIIFHALLALLPSIV